MRYMLMGLLVLFLPLQAELNVKKIETMVQKIQNKRVSSREVDFVKVPSPFVVVVPRDENHTTLQIQSPENRVQFTLSAIINGRAYINGVWVQPGESISGYLVEEIKPGEVLLKKEKREIRLFLPEQKKENLLQISEG